MREDEIFRMLLEIEIIDNGEFSAHGKISVNPDFELGTDCFSSLVDMTDPQQANTTDDVSSSASSEISSPLKSKRARIDGKYICTSPAHQDEEESK